MALTDNQIERYSRQIIVPGVGGRAQERLLASCVAIVAESADAAGAVAYLAGAGVGRIVMHPVGERASYDALVERSRDLNPDVSVSLARDGISARCNLMLALVGDTRTADAAARVARADRCGAAVIARLDIPGRIALLPAPPPCPLCADAELLSPPGKRAASCGEIAMVAVAEAFKMLAGFAGQQPAAELLEFNCYVTWARALGRRRVRGGGSKTRCACEALS
jgi:hypothetical protein